MSIRDHTIHTYLHSPCITRTRAQICLYASQERENPDDEDSTECIKSRCRAIVSHPVPLHFTGLPFSFLFSPPSASFSVLSVCMCERERARVCARVFVCVRACVCVCVSVCLSVCLSVYLKMCLFYLIFNVHPGRIGPEMSVCYQFV